MRGMAKASGTSRARGFDGVETWVGSSRSDEN